MEAAFYIADLLATVLLMYWVVRGVDRLPSAPSVGLFAYRETLKPAARLRADDAATARSRSRPPLPGASGEPGAATARWWEPGRRHPRRQDKSR